MAPSRTPLLSAVALLAGGVGLLLYARSDRADEGKPPMSLDPAQTDQKPNNGAPSAPLTAKQLPSTSADRVQTLPAPPPTHEPASPRTFGLPDGTRLPVLNGAYGAPDIQWPAGIPWSPVVGKLLDNDGQEWYVHADGTYSSTVMTFRSDLGRHEPVTQVAHPQEAAPMDPAQTGGPDK